MFLLLGERLVTAASFYGASVPTWYVLLALSGCVRSFNGNFQWAKLQFAHASVGEARDF
jgi:hypothetical protein